MKLAQFLFFGAMFLNFSMNDVVLAAPVELGKVQWSRDYEASLTAAGKSGKPVLILFQEVPG